MSAETFDYCVRAGLTDVGCKRSANEDNLGQAITINGLVTVVCDGMGGHVGGAVASKIAVDTILAFLNQQYFADPREAIVAAVNAANQAILARAAAEPSLYGMGSTCVMLIIREGLVYYGWVGDSRIYLFRQDKTVRLSKDQSVVQALVDAGQITEAEAEHHARKNEITNALGLPTMTPALVCRQPIAPHAGDTFLLCSDGLSGMVSDNDIAAVVSDRANLRLPDRAARLIEMAKANGGLDNVTALLVEFPVAPNPVGTSSPASPRTAGPGKNDSSNKALKRWIIPGAILTALIVIAAAAWLIFGGKGEKTDDDKSSAAVEQTSAAETNSTPVELKSIEAKNVKPVTRVTYSLDVTSVKEEECLLFIFYNDNVFKIYSANDPDNTLLSIDGSIDPTSLSVSDNLKLVTGSDLKTSDKFHVQKGATPVGITVTNKKSDVTEIRFKTPEGEQPATEYILKLTITTPTPTPTNGL